MSEVSKIFESLPKRFEKANVKVPRTFYFSLDDEEKWTVSVSKAKCTVKEGKPAKDADCFFKASKEMFLDVWNGKYTPSAKDFFTGAIKSNNPLLLEEFIAAFQKKTSG
jgi:putative sterol carrier protein